MGPCSVNSVTLPDGKSWSSGNRQVFVEKYKYLEESKCLGICINTCKLPTQVCLCLAYGILDFYSSIYSLTACVQVEFSIKSTGTMISNLTMFFDGYSQFHRMVFKMPFFAERNQKVFLIGMPFYFRTLCIVDESDF